MAEHLEIERKFDVGEDFERPDFGAIGGVRPAGPVTRQLSATYYDTSDQRLAAAGVTLRRRAGGDDEGWHLKLPASPGPASPGPGPALARRELREPLSDEPPAALAARVAALTDGAPLAPIATLDTERIVVTLSVNGSVVAEVDDDVVTARRLPGGAALRWREIEVEVSQPGEPADRVAGAAAEELEKAGARPARSSSKLARLLAGG
ncbi:MAG: CYTH domain-containing protein [Nocardiopsaceae bacterium]|nr:CYTH domain-containing protein [Nocardiopsaceae bacterium]